MHQGCVRWRQRRREGSGGVVADIAKLSVGREEYYTRELATDHEQYLSGHELLPVHDQLRVVEPMRPSRSKALSSRLHRSSILGRPPRRPSADPLC
jgi:hypothetical protein